MRTLLRYSLFLIFTLFLSNSYCQEAVLSSGGDIENANGNVSFSIGQAFYQVLSNDEFSVSEGVQNPIEISIIDGLNRIENLEYNFSVYPNPTLFDLNLKIDNSDFEKLSYQLYSMEGKLLIDNNISNIETSIPMEEYTPGFYLLKIYSNNEEIQSFKVIKQ